MILIFLTDNFSPFERRVEHLSGVLICYFSPLIQWLPITGIVNTLLKFLAVIMIFYQR